ncbi:MAG: metallophosphoesterase [Clostridiales bacterium]|nr:metallophosphoesterase [Clostridiales bacterium]
MKVYAISDLHLSINNPKPMDIFGEVWDNYLDDIEKSLESVTADDLVLLAGDLSWAMTLEQAVPDLQYIGTLPGKKIIIRGNHDYWWKSISAVRGTLPDNVFAIQNDSVKIGDVIVGGSRGWSADDKTEDGKRLYARELLRIEMSLKAMQQLKTGGERTVFMIHYPPFNVRFESTPVTDLFEKYGVDAVVYGHLHGKNCYARKTYTKNGIKYLLTSCDQIDNNAVTVL